MSETTIVARLEDIASSHRSRGAHRDCRVHDRFEPDCGFCQVTAIDDAIAALRAGADALRGLVKLRAALVGLIGVDGRDELEAMEATMRLLPAPAADKAASIDAIHALLATLPETEECE